MPRIKYNFNIEFIEKLFFLIIINGLCKEVESWQLYVAICISSERTLCQFFDTA